MNGLANHLCSNGSPPRACCFDSFSALRVLTKTSELVCFENLRRWRTRLLEKIAWSVSSLQPCQSEAWLSEHLLIFDSNQISEWILLLAAFVLVGLRMYTRLLVQRQKLRLSEYVLLFSALIGLGLIICE
jgi:hypothetical protein